jgi:hypothetical protein
VVTAHVALDCTDITKLCGTLVAPVRPGLGGGRERTVSTTYSSTSASPWTEAVSTHAHLTAGGRIRPIAPPFPFLVPAAGEQALAVFDLGITYARYCTAQVMPTGGGPTMIMGSAPFLAGIVATGTLLQARARRRAREYCAAQWRPATLLRTVVTTRRLWCELNEAGGPRWLHFNFETITLLNLTGNALTMSFADSDPLALAGDWAPWCAAVIAHNRFGRGAAAAVPTLNNAAWAS